MMKAAVYKTYGSPEVVRIEEVAKPIPSDNEVLIKIHASTVSAGDWRMRSLNMPRGFGPLGRLVAGVFKPRQPVLGTDLAGEIVAIGANVTKFAVGDEVIAYPGSGCHAQYLSMAEDGIIVPKPVNLTMEAAAAISFGGSTALEFLREKGNIQPGEKVLIVGASGSTGSAAVQVAKYFGAHVTGVTSTGNLELVKSLGADEVIDYRREDFATNGKTYDIIVDCVGSAPWKKSKGSLTKTGRLLLIAGSLGDMLSAPFVSRKHGKKLVAGVSMGSIEVLQLLSELAATKKVTPLIDRVYQLEQIVEAHRHVDSGRKKGNVVVQMVPPQRLIQAA